MMNAEAATTMTKGPAKPARRPTVPAPDPIDLDRVVFDPEYRARVRDALNRAGRTPPSRPAEAARRMGRGRA